MIKLQSIRSRTSIQSGESPQRTTELTSLIVSDKPFEKQRSIYEIMLTPSKPQKKVAVQKGVMKMSEGVFMLPKTCLIHHKGPFPQSKASNELNMGV